MTSALLFLGLTSVSHLAVAQSVFNGTWRPEPQTFGPTRKLDVVELNEGVYGCESCTPPYQVQADGQDHSVSSPFYDTLNVSIIDDWTVLRIAKKAGKTVDDDKSIVSADGKTKTDVHTMYDMAARPIEVTSHSSLVSTGPPGSHLISGGWRMSDADVSNHAEDTIFQVKGDVLLMTDLLGRSFSAKLDGTDAPYKGSKEFNSVSVKKIDSHTIEEYDKKGGEVVKITRWSVNPDGITLHVRFDDTHGHVQEQNGRKVHP